MDLEQQENPPPKKESKSEEKKSCEDNYEDEEFENYDDDFEDVVVKKTKGSKVNAFAPDLRKPKTPLVESKKQEAVHPGKFTSMYPTRKGQSRSNLVQQEVEDFDDVKAIGIDEGSKKGGNQRCKDILSRVKLQSSRIDLFEQHSLPPWECYIRSIGAGGLKRQSFTQTNSDACDMDIQTDPIDTSELYCQGPFCGLLTDDNDDLNLKNLSQLTDEMEKVLEENISFLFTGVQESKISEEPTAVFASRTINIDDLGDMSDRMVKDLHFSQSNSNVLVAALAPFPGSTVSSRLLMWDVGSKTPLLLATLVCESRITCSLISPVTSNIVIAGTEDGSIYMWNIKLSASDRTYLPICYTGFEDIHLSCIVELVLLPNATAFQFASMDDTSVVHVWNVLESDEPTLNSDFKLVHISEIPTTLLPGAMTLRFHPTDSNQLFVATSTGSISHCTRQGLFASPKKYTLNKPLDMRYSMVNMNACGVIATSIEFNPVAHEIFAAGFSDGTFALFHSKHASPLKTFTMTSEMSTKCGFGFLPIERVCWSSSSVLFVYDAGFNIYIWDFAADVDAPILTSKNENVKLEHAKPIVTYSPGMGSLSRIATVTSNSKIEFHLLNPSTSPRQMNDANELEQLFFNIF